MPGTVRQAALAGLPDRVSERPVTVSDLTGSDEAFLTNALLGVMPLIAVDDRPIGTGVPGPVTLSVAELLAR